MDNSRGKDGECVITVRSRKAFRFENDGTITQKHLLEHAFVLDNQTVTATDGSAAASGGNPAKPATNCRAGTIVAIDADGVWIY